MIYISLDSYDKFFHCIDVFVLVVVYELLLGLISEVNTFVNDMTNRAYQNLLIDLANAFAEALVNGRRDLA